MEYDHLFLQDVGDNIDFLQIAGFEFISFSTAGEHDDVVLDQSHFSGDVYSIGVNAGVTLTVKDASFVNADIRGGTLIVDNVAMDEVIGGKDADEAVLTGETLQVRQVRLGEGDDVLHVDDVSRVEQLIDGGEGHDTIFLKGSGALQFDKIVGFEEVVLSGDDGAAALQLSGDLLGTQITLQTDASFSAGILERAELDSSASAVSFTLAEDGKLGELTSSGAGGSAVTNSGVIFGDVQLGEGDDSYIAQGGGRAGTVSGGAGNDSFVSGEAGGSYAGGAGDDSFRSGTGRDRHEGGEGLDTFSGTASELDGDFIEGFELGETIEILDAVLHNGDISAIANDDSAILTFGDSSLVLQGDFAGAGFLAVGQANGSTELALLRELASLKEGEAVAAGDMHGMEGSKYLSAETSSSFEVTLQPAEAGAGFNNSLGVYEVRADGSIADVRLLAANVKDGGTFTVADVDAGSTLGFFIPAGRSICRGRSGRQAGHRPFERNRGADTGRGGGCGRRHLRQPRCFAERRRCRACALRSCTERRRRAARGVRGYDAHR